MVEDCNCGQGCRGEEGQFVMEWARGREGYQSSR